jgi:hypothetical protein
MVERKTISRNILGTIIKLKFFKVSLVLVARYILEGFKFSPSSRLGFIHIIFDILSRDSTGRGASCSECRI